MGHHPFSLSGVKLIVKVENQYKIKMVHVETKLKRLIFFFFFPLRIVRFSPKSFISGCGEIFTFHLKFMV